MVMLVTPTAIVLTFHMATESKSCPCLQREVGIEEKKRIKPHALLDPYFRILKQKMLYIYTFVVLWFQKFYFGMKITYLILICHTQPYGKNFGGLIFICQ
jgi:hypothetical protein